MCGFTETSTQPYRFKFDNMVGIFVSSLFNPRILDTLYTKVTSDITVGEEIEIFGILKKDKNGWFIDKQFAFALDAYEELIESYFDDQIEIGVRVFFSSIFIGLSAAVIYKASVYLYRQYGFYLLQ
jgi:hypothetical protein